MSQSCARCEQVAVLRLRVAADTGERATSLGFIPSGFVAQPCEAVEDLCEVLIGKTGTMVLDFQFSHPAVHGSADPDRAFR